MASRCLLKNKNLLPVACEASMMWSVSCAFLYQLTLHPGLPSVPRDTHFAPISGPLHLLVPLSAHPLN